MVPMMRPDLSIRSAGLTKAQFLAWCAANGVDLPDPADMPRRRALRPAPRPHNLRWDPFRRRYVFAPLLGDYLGGP